MKQTEIVLVRIRAKGSVPFASEFSPIPDKALISLLRWNGSDVTTRSVVAGTISNACRSAPGEPSMQLRNGIVRIASGARVGK